LAPASCQKLSGSGSKKLRLIFINLAEPKPRRANSTLQNWPRRLRITETLAKSSVSP
jgi:hypothetical protein